MRRETKQFSKNTRTLKMSVIQELINKNIQDFRKQLEKWQKCALPYKQFKQKLISTITMQRLADGLKTNKNMN